VSFRKAIGWSTPARRETVGASGPPGVVSIRRSVMSTLYTPVGGTQAGARAQAGAAS
jgi:hypothetical protein